MQASAEHEAELQRSLALRESQRAEAAQIIASQRQGRTMLVSNYTRVVEPQRGEGAGSYRYYWRNAFAHVKSRWLDHLQPAADVDMEEALHKMQGRAIAFEEFQRGVSSAADRLTS